MSLDSNQRQQIISSVQQQLALQNAQQLLQVKFSKKFFSYLNLYLRNYLINVSKFIFKNPEVLYRVQNRFEYRIFLNEINLYLYRNV